MGKKCWTETQRKIPEDLLYRPNKPEYRETILEHGNDKEWNDFDDIEILDKQRN